MRNLIKNSVITEKQARHLNATMTETFPEAMVVDFASLIPAMQNDPKDRHVAAAAVKVGADLIVTKNLKDFQSLPDGVEARSPDDFLSDIWDLDPNRVKEVVQRQAEDMKRPPRTFEDVLKNLHTSVPHFVELLTA